MWRTVKGGPWATTREQVAKDLNHLAKFAHAGAWAALGGEPLLHWDLPGIIKTARDSGIADSYGVWSNGMLVRKQKDEFWKAIDGLVISRYPGKLADEDMDWMAKKCQDEGVAFFPRDERPGKQPNFMTNLEPFPTDGPTTQRKYDGCAFRRGHNYAASYGYFFMCCCGPHVPMLIQGREFGEDGARIEGMDEAGLAAYIGRRDPLGACTVCAGRDTAKPIPWSEQKNPVIWLKASAGV